MASPSGIINLRDLALFNVAMDSKLRGCDLVKLAVSYRVKDERERASVIQTKTNRPVQFEPTENRNCSKSDQST